VARGAAGAAVGRDTGFEEQLAAELDAGRRVRVIVDMRGVGQGLEQATRALEQRTVGIVGGNEADTEQAGTGEEGDGGGTPGGASKFHGQRGLN
jgi:hypothetical protein